jgi:soluble P-type ATPase
MNLDDALLRADEPRRPLDWRFRRAVALSKTTGKARKTWPTDDKLICDYADMLYRLGEQESFPEMEKIRKKYPDLFRVHLTYATLNATELALTDAMLLCRSVDPELVKGQTCQTGMNELQQQYYRQLFLDIMDRRQMTSFIASQIMEPSKLRSTETERSVQDDLEQAEPVLESLENEGKTAMVMARRGLPVGVLAVADTIKENAAGAIAELQRMNIEIYMLTGDNRRTAEAIARQAGIANVLAEVLPEHKAEEIARLQGEGKVVAMVGDGINDAPALATADIGMAMSTGADVAMAAADVTLLRGDLRTIPMAVRLSRNTMGKIKQNLFWAFFYNIIGIPIAACGLLSPVVAGAAMAFSSVSVVANSLSLKRTNIQ